MKIQRLFKNGIAYEVSKNQHGGKGAFGELVQEITITPKFIGSRSAYDVAYLLMQAYLVFVSQLPP